jgi:hypothetical protein
LNETTEEIPTYGGLEVQTLEDLMDAITSIVTIGMAGEPRSVIRHLSFTRFWADRLAELAERQPSRISLALLLRIDPREVARGLAPAWSLPSEADCRRGIVLLQQHARAFARREQLFSPTRVRPTGAGLTTSVSQPDPVDPAGPIPKKIR